MQTTSPLPRLLTRQELAHLLNVPVSWIDRAVSERRIPGVHKLGHRTVRFDQAKILNWLQTNELNFIQESSS